MRDIVPNAEDRTLANEALSRAVANWKANPPAPNSLGAIKMMVAECEIAIANARENATIKPAAVFTPDEVERLEKHQRRARTHPFTCGNRDDGNHRENDVDLGVLVPTVRGWICPYCDYIQTWAYGSMAGSKAEKIGRHD